MVQLPAGPVLADASFLVAIAESDPDAARFVSVLRRSSVTTVNFGEVLYKLAQKAGMAVQTTEQVFAGALGVMIEPVELAVVRHFSALKQIDAASRSAQTASGAAPVKSLSLADMTCLGYAIERGLPVLTGDKHWLTLAEHGLRVSVYDFRNLSLSP